MSRPTPSGREKVLGEDDLIVSKTDLRGVITYGNRSFIAFSGYGEEELLGAPHNLIRHPDMPRAVFQLLWERIQAGREVFAYVVNLSKDGSHYWVLANVMVARDAQDQPVGYYSVRRKPRPSSIQAVSALYAAMRDVEQRLGGTEGMSAARKLLEDLCAQKGGTYDQVVLGL